MADGFDEFKVKRQEVYEFTAKPTVAGQADRWEIRFASKAFCDATVAIEAALDSAGEGSPAAGSGPGSRAARIIRHLASGLLGPNAPEPFQKGSLAQIVPWDGKDDQGRYVENLAKCSVRVSLGLRASLERTLFWHPKKRVGVGRSPLFAARPDGVYLYEGDGVEHLRLFDHQANYVRAIYPFPADKVRQAKGLGWDQFPPDDYAAPRKIGYWLSTMLTGGLARTDVEPGDQFHGLAVSADGHVALAAETLTRLATDGTTGGLPLYGPTVALNSGRERDREIFRPKALAFSPDGRFLYLTGYYQNVEHKVYGNYGPVVFWKHGLYRMEFAKAEPPSLFLGADALGSDDAHFNMPADVAVDATGRILVADWANNRVQIFSAEGKLAGSLNVSGPARIQIHHATGEIYVFSWAMGNREAPQTHVAAKLRKFSPPPNARQTAEYDLPLAGNYRDSTVGGRGDESPYRAALDSWTDPATIWLVPAGVGYNSRFEETCVHRLVEKGGKLEPVERFFDAVAAAKIRQRPPMMERQRLYVNPRDGTLYVAEGDSGVGKTFTRLVKIDPASGRCSEVELPFSPEDLAFDVNGLAYLRTDVLVARFSPETWREVPWDYGEDRRVQFASDCKAANLLSGLGIPSLKPVYWHQSGFDVNSLGDMVVSCYNSNKPEQRMRDGKNAVPNVGKPYVPRLYPGRVCYGELHVWDLHGRAKVEDAIPGIPDGHGTFIDRRGDLYVLVAGTRLIDGTKPFAPLTGSIMKFKPGKGRFISDSKTADIPLGDKLPDGKPILACGNKGNLWVEGYEWIYSGVGFVRPGAPCQCWNCRFGMDLFGRSFAPETLRSQVAILDSAGNLLFRVGRYGNIEDGKPAGGLPADYTDSSDSSNSKSAKSAESVGRSAGAAGPPNCRSIGGDEVSLVYPVYVASHTDHRLFIADPGNGRIVGVRLDYRASERVPLGEAGAYLKRN